MLPGTRRMLAGPPLRLPRPLDRAAEAWWAAPPRARLLAAVSLVGLLVAAAVGHATATPYGPPVAVHVAARDLAVGETIGAQDVRRTTWPRDLVPSGADTPPTGIVRAALPRGAIVTDRHLGDGGPADGLPAGRVAIAVPHEVLPALPPGTWLDLVGAASDGQVRTLARTALLLHLDATHAWVALDEADAASVSAAAAVGALAAVVRPP